MDLDTRNSLADKFDIPVSVAGKDLGVLDEADMEWQGRLCSG